MEQTPFVIVAWIPCDREAWAGLRAASLRSRQRPWLRGAAPAAMRPLAAHGGQRWQCRDGRRDSGIGATSRQRRGRPTAPPQPVLGWRGEVQPTAKKAKPAAKPPASGASGGRRRAVSAVADELVADDTPAGAVAAPAEAEPSADGDVPLPLAPAAILPAIVVVAAAAPPPPPPSPPPLPENPPPPIPVNAHDAPAPVVLVPMVVVVPPDVNALGVAPDAVNPAVANAAPGAAAKKRQFRWSDALERDMLAAYDRVLAAGGRQDGAHATARTRRRARARTTYVS